MTSDERRHQIFEAIERECRYQDAKLGNARRRSLPVGIWMLIMEVGIKEANEAFDFGNLDDALREILKVVAVGVACLETHGVVERPPEDWDRLRRDGDTTA